MVVAVVVVIIVIVVIIVYTPAKRIHVFIIQSDFMWINYGQIRKLTVLKFTQNLSVVGDSRGEGVRMCVSRQYSVSKNSYCDSQITNF